MNEKANILIVDDEMGPRESMRMILSPYHNVYTAESGARAIELLGQVAFDLVTLDLKMPGIPGIKVLEKVKEHDPDIEAIIVTGYGSMDTAVEGLRLGAFDYISKPFDVSHILSLVKRALERRHAKLRLRQLKTDFLSNVSHELRTPISVVVGFVYLLLNQVIGKLTEEQQRVLEKVYRNSEELLELIDNVLCMTSINAGESLVLQAEFDLPGLVREMLKRYEKILSTKGVRLTLEAPDQLRVVSDRAKVERIFQNLLNNAAKFTSQGEITVKVQPASDQRTVCLEVIDTGVGIERDQIETMFEAFKQMDSSAKREFSGLGLGLTVARRLTDLLGGNLSIQSQPGQGTHVFLTLPRSLEPARNLPMQQGF
ncbi:MAG TPA: ATP-binding protein [Candidatus Acidoferrales bacterium]|nr:ATP-binding protein [Candidatus Acidoferrales bacterium]